MPKEQMENLFIDSEVNTKRGRNRCAVLTREITPLKEGIS